jgi:predicted RNA-binding Zn-ribbon protein involved in translation (DUF1610 family)
MMVTEILGVHEHNQLANATCPRCGERFRLVWNGDKMKKTIGERIRERREKLKHLEGDADLESPALMRISWGSVSGVFAVLIQCPHCGFKEEI